MPRLRQRCCQVMRVWNNLMMSETLNKTLFFYSSFQQSVYPHRSQTRRGTAPSPLNRHVATVISISVSRHQQDLCQSCHFITSRNDCLMLTITAARKHSVTQSYKVSEVVVLNIFYFGSSSLKFTFIPDVTPWCICFYSRKISWFFSTSSILWQ